MARLTHVDRSGKAAMVDVGRKKSTARRAVACAVVELSAEAFEQLRENRLAKGDALAVARLAGIQAAKRASEWIPLCHAIPLDHVEIEIELHEEDRTARIRAGAAARWTTGVEMEALVGVSAAALALYDMAKAVDRGIVIRDIRLVSKRGGKSGDWERSPV